MHKKVKAGRATSTKDNMAFVGILSTQALHHLYIDGYADNVLKRANRLAAKTEGNLNEATHVC